MDSKTTTTTTEAPRKYVPPHMRNKLIEEASKPKFEKPVDKFATSEPKAEPKFLGNTRTRSDWSQDRDSRFSAFSKPSFFGGNNYKRDEDAEEALFQSQSASGINFDKYEDIPVEVRGKNCPPPLNTFADIADLDPSLKKNIMRAKYEKPTPVQKYALPIALAGRDIMACAQTGSGKTAAFLFPTIQHMLKEGVSEDTAPSFITRRAYPSALILAPTRELSTQIYDEARKFTFQTNLKCCVVYGGADPKFQIQQLQRGCQILVATPGRLVDLMDRGYVTLAGIRVLILDEADRMLDMGFEPQIRQIVQNEAMPDVNSRQTLMFSATFPKEIQKLAQEFLSSYVFLSVGRVGSTADFIKQTFEYVEEDDKFHYLLKLISGIQQKCLVFVKTKKCADEVEHFLQQNSVAAIAIHGDRTQKEREFALKKFKKGLNNILVATDVAARGLDIDNVVQVINFDLPENIDDYVHRIGRTGRAGNSGLAVGFFNELNKGIARELIELLEECTQEVPAFIREAAKSAIMDRRMKKMGGSRGFGGSFGGRGRGGRGRGGFGFGGRGGARGRGGNFSSLPRPQYSNDGYDDDDGSFDYE